MMWLISSQIFLYISLISAVLGQGGDPIFSAKDEVDEKDLACAACVAIVDIVNQHMEKKSFDGVESRLYDVMENICTQKNFPAYDFIPPKMVEACRKFTNKHDEEELMSIFQKYYTAGKRAGQNMLERKVCLNFSGDCVGNKRVETKDKKTYAEKVAEVAQQDKNFDVNVDDILEKHAHKLKHPEPVKHNEL